MRIRWLIIVPAIAVASSAAAQSPESEWALLVCKNAAIEEVLRTGGSSVSRVRFPPGALVWPGKDKPSRVEGPGQYRAGSEWREFTYTCTYEPTTAKTRVTVQRTDAKADRKAAQQSASPQSAPAPRSR
jgi:hypothetical protein